MMQSAANAPGTSSATNSLPGIGTAAAAVVGVLSGGGGLTLKCRKVKTTSGEGPGPSTTEETFFKMSL